MTPRIKSDGVTILVGTLSVVIQGRGRGRGVSPSRGLKTAAATAIRNNAGRNEGGAGPAPAPPAGGNGAVGTAGSAAKEGIREAGAAVIVGVVQERVFQNTYFSLADIR